MKIYHAYTKGLGFCKVPLYTLKEFKQAYPDHVLKDTKEEVEREVQAGR
jgi:hypothetical protein